MAEMSLEKLMNELSLNNKDPISHNNNSNDDCNRTKTTSFRVNRNASYESDESDADSLSENSSDDYSDDEYSSKCSHSSNSSSGESSDDLSSDDSEEENLTQRTVFKTIDDNKGVEHRTLSNCQKPKKEKRSRRTKRIWEYYEGNDRQIPNSPLQQLQSPPPLANSPSSSYKASSVLNLNDSFTNSPQYSIDSVGQLTYDSLDEFDFSTINITNQIEKTEKEKKKELLKNILRLIVGRKKLKDISLQKPYANNYALLHDIAENNIFVIKIDSYLASVLSLMKDSVVELNSYEFASYLIPRIQRDAKVKKDPSLMNYFFTQKNLSGETPVMIAVRKNNLDLLKLFISHIKLNQQIQQPMLHTLLQIAAKYGSYSCFKYLIHNHYTKEEDVQVICHFDIHGENCLNTAIKSHNATINNVEIIKELIKTKYFIVTDCKTYSNLIQENVEFNDDERNCLLHLLEVVKIEQFNQESLVMDALRKNKVNLVKSLIPRNVLDEFEQPVIHMLLQVACMHGSYECFKYLYEYYGTKENATNILHLIDTNGYNCLNLSIKSHNKTIDNVKIIQEIIKTNRIKIDECQQYSTLILENGYFTNDERNVLFETMKNSTMEDARLEEFNLDFTEIICNLND